MERYNTDSNCKTPPKWKRPEDVMKLHKLKVKKRNLLSRESDNISKVIEEPKINNRKSNASKNPFRLESKNSNNAKKAKLEEIINEPSVDGTLFRLINFSQNQTTQDTLQDVTFNDLLNKLTTPPKVSQESKRTESKNSEGLLVDWSLRTKVRLLSNKRFPWNQKLKTDEEASSITRFVRCIDEDNANVNCTLSSSPNVKFRKCCLIWQHPSIPWLELYPRIGAKLSVSSNNVSLLPLKDSLYRDWVQSFNSLFQLVRANQCPYFYLISNTFVCLFRAAGVSGYPEVNATLTPTTRGFRQLLRDEDIQFTMPLKTSNESSSSSSKNLSLHSDDTGYESLDMINEFNEMEEEDELELNNNPSDEEETEIWLKNLGVEETEIIKLNSNQMDMETSRQIDSKPQSLIFIEGMETQAFFNFLMNCKSIIPTTGQFSGIPPTLLAPVAFTGSTLKSLKVRESEIQMNGKCYHSMEIRGPILPHTVHTLCDTMKNSSLDKFSLTFANIEMTKSFSLATCRQLSNDFADKSQYSEHDSISKRKNLTNSGESESSVLSNFCSSDVKQFDSVRFCDNQFTCM